MAEVISLVERIFERKRSETTNERRVVIVQGVRARGAHALARALKRLGGGVIVEADAEICDSMDRASMEVECSSCSLREKLEACLSRVIQEVPEHRDPIWLIPPVDADPWAVVDAFASENLLHEKGFRIRAWVTAINAESLFSDWVSSRKVGRSRAVPMIEAIADQIDFSNALILFGNSASCVTAEVFLRRLNERAEIFREFELVKGWVTGLLDRDFSSEETANGARWRQALQASQGSIEGEVYRRDRPFHPERLHQLVQRWPEGILRSEGTAWIASETDVVFTVTQVGPKLFDCSGNGYWLATLSEEEIEQARVDHPQAFESWNPSTGDRMTELAFVWNSPAEKLHQGGLFFKELDECLLSDFEMRLDWNRFRDPFCEDREKASDQSEKRGFHQRQTKALQVLGLNSGGDYHGNTKEKDFEESP